MISPERKELLRALARLDTPDAAWHENAAQRFFPTMSHVNAITPSQWLVTGRPGAGKTAMRETMLAAQRRLPELLGERRAPLWSVAVGYATQHGDRFWHTLSSGAVASPQLLQALWLLNLLRACAPLFPPDPLHHPEVASLLADGASPAESLAARLLTLGLAPDSYLARVAEILNVQGTGLFVVYDDLDRLPAESGTALIEALLRFWSYYGERFQNVQPKVFLREAVASAVLRNLPDRAKLDSRRSALAWSFGESFGALARQLTAGDAVANKWVRALPSIEWRTTEHFGAIPEPLTLAAQRALIGGLYGSVVGQGILRSETVRWITDRLRDGLDQVVPRALLGLIGGSAKLALSQRVSSGRHLIDVPCLERALPDVATRRWQEITEELPAALDLETLLAGRLLPLPKAEVLSLLGAPKRDVSQAKRLFDELLGAGVFKLRADGRLDLPEPFRIALKVERGGVPVPGRLPSRSSPNPKVRRIDSVSRHASDSVKAAPQLDELLLAMERGLAEVRAFPTQTHHFWPAETIVQAAVERALALADPDRAKEQLAVLRRRSREESERIAHWHPDYGVSSEGTSAQSLDDAPPSAEQLGMIAAAFGDRYGYWLAIVAEHFGQARLNLAGHDGAQLDVGAAVSALGPETPVEDRQRARLALMVDFFDQASEQTALELHALNDAPLLPAQAEKLRDLIAVSDFRHGRPVNGVASLPSAQASRRHGFMAYLRGDATEAAAAYAEAVERSAEEEEPPIDQWLTIEAAIHAARTNVERTETIGVRGLMVRMSRLDRRVAAWTEHFAEMDAKIRDQVIQRLEERERGDSVIHVGEVPGEALIRWLEARWASPARLGDLANAVGRALWYDGQRVGGARLLARYGCKPLASLVGEMVRSGDRGPVEPALVAALLEPGRVPSEWLRRAEALVAVIPELPYKSLPLLRVWIREGRVALSAQSGVASGEEYTFAHDLDEVARVTREWLAHEPGAVVPTVREWLDDAQHERDISALASEVVQLPWLRWMQVGWMQPATVDALLVEVMKRARLAWRPFRMERRMPWALELLMSGRDTELPELRRLLTEWQTRGPELRLDSTSDEMALALTLLPSLRRDIADRVFEATVLGRRPAIRSWSLDSGLELLQVCVPYMAEGQVEILVERLDAWLDINDAGGHFMSPSQRRARVVGAIVLGILRRSGVDPRARDLAGLALRRCVRMDAGSLRLAASAVAQGLVDGGVWLDLPVMRALSGVGKTETNQPSRARYWGLHAVGRWVEGGATPPSGALDIVATMTRSEDEVIAVSAITVLGSAVFRQVLVPSEYESWSRWLTSAADDPRAKVIGRVAQAVLLSRAYAGPHIPDGVTARVLGDERLEIKTAIAWIQALIRDPSLADLE